MNVWRGLDELLAPESGTALTIGTFDGVHLGHRALIAGTFEESRERGLMTVAVTWDRHPAQTVRPDKVPPLLTSLDRKIELLGETGISTTAVLDFDEELSSWSPERFVEEVLVGGLNAKLVRVGHDWRFGHKAAGDVELLEKLGADHGFEVDGVQLEQLGVEPVSSTRVRTAVAAGEMETATQLLTRPFDVDGMVVRGDGRGASLGFPTANLDIDDALARPAEGVYAGRMRIEGTWHRAAINVGKNLTFGGETIRVEAYVLDFEGDLYGKSVRLEFHHRLRDELKFDSVDALIAQMHGDVARTRELIEL